MKKHANVILNVVLYLCFCGMAGSGLLLEFRLCEHAYSSVLGMTAEDWGDIHEWTAYVFAATVAFHLALHWAWIRSQAAKHVWSTTLAVIAGVCVILGPLFAPGQTAGQGSHGPRHCVACSPSAPCIPRMES